MKLFLASLVLVFSLQFASAATVCTTTIGSGKCTVGNLCVALSWQAPTTGGPYIGYNIFRGTTAGGEGATPINSSLITGLTYEDDNVTFGNSYFYFAESEEMGGFLSVPSNETCAQTPASPQAPTGFSASPEA